MIKTAIFSVLLAIGIFIYFSYPNVLPAPTLPEPNWGLRNINKSTEIRPFKIDIPTSVIEDLRYRLAHRRPFTNPLENTAWTYGISTKYLDTVLDYWISKYNWTERQALLNKYPQFKTNIQGLDIHFYHVKPTNLPKERNVKVLPLLILHGWPGSIVEFQKIIPMLTKPSANYDFVFELIIPSLPGYGFSEGAVRPGLGPAQIAVIFKNLMQRLGFEKFYVQGGDWGSVIVSNMAILYPKMAIGVHITMCASLKPQTLFWFTIGSYFPSLVLNNEDYSKFYPVDKILRNLLVGSGYLHIQATKPDTLGTALSSSPDGLAAYILEKFSLGTNKAYIEREDGGLLEKFTLDELLDNIMVYWVTNSITTSVRLYAENFNIAYRALKVEEFPIKVPTACAVFPHEILIQPKSLLLTKYPYLIQYNYLSRGGHFSAMEEPQLLSDDVFSFVRKAELINNIKSNS
ncbi:juvenile hormone epoxide hydrolase 1-like [Colletes latitarsis]|uniref:juvenile hormone epoxide hydrolase 1-like n=1 Tax=Colletes latitarsis TaxID=2605962 RepID=UPI0040362914